MQELINIEDKMKKLKDYLIDQHDIMVCYLFGSYGTEYQTSLSDIDFAILFKEELEVNLMREMEIMAELSLILGVEDIDLFNLNKAPIYLQHEIIKTGKLIFERDSEELSNFIEYVLTFYYDERIRLSRFYEEYNQSLEEEYLNDQ